MKLSVRGNSSGLDLEERTHIMGILNVTPDSFYDGGKYYSEELALKKALQMEKEGADLIDVGGVSTRPGSTAPSLEEERERVISLIRELAKKLSLPLSIDTFRAEVAREALDLGVSIVNDITALRGDEKMAEVVAQYDVPVVLMHMKGQPHTMQLNPSYDNVIEEITDFLAERIKFAKDAGIKEENILIDPGIGFGKRLEDNLTIIRELKQFSCLEKPLLLGPSRKSFIGQVLDLPASERLMGTAAAVALAISQGVHILRVHDVGEMLQVARIADAVAKEKPIES